MDPQLSAALWLRVDPQAPADQAHSLLKANQPEPAPTSLLGEIESAPVVSDDHLHTVRSGSQGDAHLARAGMRGDVAQRLLGDAVQAQRNVRRNGIEAGSGGQRDIHGVQALNLGAMCLQRSDEAHAFEHSRMQLM